MAKERRFEPDVVVDEELLDVTGAGNPRGQRLRQAAAAVLGQQQSEHDEVRSRYQIRYIYLGSMPSVSNWLAIYSKDGRNHVTSACDAFAC